MGLRFQLAIIGIALTGACSSSNENASGAAGTSTGASGGSTSGGTCACPAVAPKCCGVNLCVSDFDPATGCGGPTCDPCPIHPNATAVCESGACTIACNANKADCDGDPTSGCEVDLLADLAHCGGCDQMCAAPNAPVTCNVGTCEITACPAGLDDCNGKITDGCEQDVLTDVAHCGGCNATCDGTCAAGQCQPLKQSTIEDVATGLDYNINENWPPCRLALDATTAYITTGTSVVSVPKAGSAKQTLASSIYPLPIAVDATHVYFSSNDGIQRVPLGAGQAPTTLTPEMASCLALDATHVYFTGAGGVYVLGKDATPATETPVLLAPGIGNGSLALDATDIFWVASASVIDPDQVWRVGIDGLGATKIFESSTIWSIAVDMTALYVTETHSLHALSKDGSSDTLLTGLSVPGGTIFAKGVATDGANVYVPTYNASPWAMLRVPAGGGSSTKLVNAQGRIGSVAVDEAHVYWIDVANGALRRAEK